MRKMMRNIQELNNEGHLETEVNENQESTKNLT